MPCVLDGQSGVTGITMVAADTIQGLIVLTNTQSTIGRVDTAVF